MCYGSVTSAFVVTREIPVRSTGGILSRRDSTHVLRSTGGRPEANSYTMQEKLDAVTRVQNGETQYFIIYDVLYTFTNLVFFLVQVCRALGGLNESTLHGWLKKEDELRSFVRDIEHSDGLTRKRARKAADTQLDRATYTWFSQKMNNNVPISGPILKAQAQKLHKQIHGESADAPDFKASGGWLSRFKKRHGIGRVVKKGESKSADTAAAEAFHPEFQEFIKDEGYIDEQIYNADETGLEYKKLSDRSLAFKDDPTAKKGFKVFKDRVTRLFCINRSGSHKMKTLMIGKFGKPRRFHHVNMDTLPVTYEFSHKAWMTTIIFHKWFQNCFVPQVRRHLQRKNLEEKAVLLLDNCPAHPPADTLKSKDGKIIAGEAGVVNERPLDQGIIHNFKQFYMKELMIHMVESGVDDVVAFLKAVHLKDVSGKAWDHITERSVVKAWNHGLPMPEEVFSDDEEDEDDQPF
uniref:tigger transposable element-derived protein 2-like n=1 Tax=Myxine glutinosa TaxID=7769 RepID=UPI00358FDD14